VSAIELYCPNSARLETLRATSPPPANAIDHVEVLPGKRALVVHCLEDVGVLDARNVVIEGGVRVSVAVLSAHRGSELPSGLLDAADAAALPSSGLERMLVVRTDSSGDYSTYTLRLASVGDPTQPPAGFDPILSSARFSFKVDCPSDFDCLPEEEECVEPAGPAPRIDYLAKDYASFRRLMVDRLAQTMPDWRERNPVDVGMALVELVAYEADNLSYHQDAVATEAYLGTARLRPSVGRHARLVDYRIHEGAAARAWVCLEVKTGVTGVELPAGTRFLPEDVRLRPSTDPSDIRPLEEAAASGAVVFESLHPTTMSAARNRVALHTWGDPHCCLPEGATSATLRAKVTDLELRRGDVLVLERVRADGEPLSADRQRHAVRLIADGAPATDPAAAGGPIDVTEVRWHQDDALPFALDLDEHDNGQAAGIARANVLLAEHGLSLTETGLRAPARGRFRPFLERRGITHAVPHDEERAAGGGGSEVEPASQATASSPESARPVVELRSEGRVWAAESELLRSGPFADRFTVEMHEDGRAQLRFGDGVNGRRPGSGQTFEARYRIGNGVAGNVGADALTQLYPAPGQTIPGDVIAARNPLAAAGGAAPEALERARLDAPEAFRRQERAVTEADYAEVTERHPEVQRAAATRRWTGSWHTIFVTVDRLGGRDVDASFEDRLRRHLDRYRMAGYDVEIDGPRYASLDLELEVCVKSGYVAADVEQAVRRALSARADPGGHRGLFHPDNWTFGQPVFLSQVIAAAMAVEGVERAVARRFQRWRGPDLGELDEGVLPLGRLEIARLDSDPSQPENGHLELDMRGGS
jgi:Baseplate J-like protein